MRFGAEQETFIMSKNPKDQNFKNFLYSHSNSGEENDRNNRFLLTAESSINSDIPLFMRSLNKINSVYPNFHYPLFSIQRETQNIRHLLRAMEDAIKILYEAAIKIKSEEKKLKVF